MSRIFSTNSGSGEALNDPSFQGFSPKARQISETVWRLMPCFFASPLVDHDRLDEVIPDGADRPGAGRVEEPVEALCGEAGAPLADGDGVDAELSGDVAVGAVRGTAEHDAAAKGQGLGRRMAACPPLQGRALSGGEGDLHCRSTATRHRCSFCQRFYLTERAARAEIPESHNFFI